MKKILFILLIFYSFGFLLTGCKYLDDEIKVKDPDVLKELQFMRDEGIITKKDYEQYIRVEEMPTKWGNTEVYFPSCEKKGLLECDQVYPREMIQNIMNDKNKGYYDKRVYELSNDPEIQAELQFMKDTMGVNLSHIRMPVSGSNYYGVAAPGSWELELIDRVGVQNMMQEGKESKKE